MTDVWLMAPACTCLLKATHVEQNPRHLGNKHFQAKHGLLGNWRTTMHNIVSSSATIHKERGRLLLTSTTSPSIPAIHHLVPSGVMRISITCSGRADIPGNASSSSPSGGGSFKWPSIIHRHEGCNRVQRDVTEEHAWNGKEHQS